MKIIQDNLPFLNTEKKKLSKNLELSICKVVLMDQKRRFIKLYTVEKFSIRLPVSMQKIVT